MMIPPLLFLIIQEKAVFVGWIERVSCCIEWGGIPTTNEEALKHARPVLAQAWRSFIDYNPRNGI